MPTYRVTGAHLDTGEPVHETFRAKDEADAKRYCSQQRWGIESLTLASNGARAEATPPASVTASADVLTAINGLRADVQTQNQLLDKTLNDRNSPFFKGIERRTYNSVGCGIVSAVFFFFVLSIILAFTGAGAFLSGILGN